MRSILGLVIGLLICAVLVSLVGENPAHVFSVMISSAFGSRFDFGMTLFISSSLVFTGLSVAIAFRAGLFNIGAEGQLTLAVAVAAVLPLLMKDPGENSWLGPVGSILVLLLAVSTAAALGLLTGWLRAKRDAHEVIVTMMFNFIVAGLLAQIVVGGFANPETQNPETRVIADSFRWNSWDPISRNLDSYGNVSVLLAILVAFTIWWVLSKTRWGYELRLVGASPSAADAAGVSISRLQIQAFAVAGGLAGLVAANEVMGAFGQVRLGFSPEYGFTGIAVALLARNHPLAILPSALLFGALQKGASDLDMETQFITRDFSRVLQAVVVLSVAALSAISHPPLQSAMMRFSGKLRQRFLRTPPKKGDQQ